MDILEQTLFELLSSHEGVLFEAARYSLEGGKRLRPKLLLSTLQSLGISQELGLYPAAALEFVHTYSLIHDDLPCMDNDLMRRGKPTTHVTFSEHIATLCGDFLLTYAFEVLAKAPNLSCKTKNQLTLLLAQRSGGCGMIEGQILDMKGSFADTEAMMKMYVKKTGFLISAPLEMAAIIANEDPKPFYEIGIHLGSAFQLIDDVIDQDGLTHILGLDKTKELANQHYQKAQEALKTLFEGTNELTVLTEQLIYRTV